MKFKREELTAAAFRLGAFSTAAAKAGRTEDARALEVGSEVCATAAERFAGANPLAQQDPADAERLHRTGLFEGSVAVEGEEAGAQACPWSQSGVCAGCPWRTTQWLFAGRRYECLTRHACRVQRELNRASPQTP